jgi:hypothetical protein
VEFLLQTANTYPSITATVAVPGKNGITVLLGITCTKTRNPPEEWKFRWEAPAHKQGIHQVNGYSDGNYQLIEDESNREWDSAGNYQLINEESNRVNNGRINNPKTSSL